MGIVKFESRAKPLQERLVESLSLDAAFSAVTATYFGLTATYRVNNAVFGAFKVHLYQYDDNKTDAEWSIELDYPVSRDAAKTLRRAIEESLRNEPKRFAWREHGGTQIALTDQATLKVA